MARPGFNGIHWFHLSFDEAVLFGWLGQFSSSVKNISEFFKHVEIYGSKIAKFYDLDRGTFERVREMLSHPAQILRVASELNQKAKCLSKFEIVGDKIHFELCPNRLAWEVNYLKEQGIQAVVSLTEVHHQRDVLQGHFDLHHFSIEDLNSPQFEQALQLAELIKEYRLKKQKLVVHCMAGIGRTSTMLMASHLLLGESFEELTALLAKQNPSFYLVGPQRDFIHTVVKNRSGLAAARV